MRGAGPVLSFASLGSGSRGNATLIRAGDTLVLVDCGFSAAEAVRRMGRLGVTADTLDAILVTHEHGDHINGVAVLSRRHKVPVYLTAGSLAACRDAGFHDFTIITPHVPFDLSGLKIRPYPVPHDAREPCQFVFESGGCRLGLLTDVGHITPHIVDSLAGVDGLLLECNYDPDMLRGGPYPVSVQARIDSHYGHLANHQARGLLRSLDCPALRLLIGMHISEKNNHPDLALAALREGIGHDASWVTVACQAEGFDWQTLS